MTTSQESCSTANIQISGLHHHQHPFHQATVRIHYSPRLPFISVQNLSVYLALVFIIFLTPLLLLFPLSHCTVLIPGTLMILLQFVVFLNPYVA